MRFAGLAAGRQMFSPAEGDFKTAGLEGNFAFKAKDLGGIMVIGSLEGGLETSLSYDSFGRRQLAKQSFTYAGRRYEAIYSGVTFDGFGRLFGYSVVLRLAPAK